MKRFKRAIKASIFVFLHEMRKPKEFTMTENRRKLMETWKSIDYADMWRPERGNLR